MTRRDGTALAMAVLARMPFATRLLGGRLLDLAVDGYHRRRRPWAAELLRPPPPIPAPRTSDHDRQRQET